VRPLVLLALACSACATAGLAPGEDCASLADSIAASRNRGDDRTADLGVERLARACPDASARSLVGGPPPGGKGASLIYVDYRITLGPNDHLTRLALTFAGRRLDRVTVLGAGELEVAAELVPGGGRPVHLTWTRKMAVTEPGLLKMTVRLARGAGARPFALDVDLPPGQKLRDLQTVGTGGNYEDRKFPRPIAEPPFEAPPELRLAGAAPTTFEICPTADGTVGRIVLDLDERLPHPRHLGSALDWLRASRYEMPPPNARGRWWCIQRTVRWDAVGTPAVRGTWRETR
jgi:hypothetical protein